MPMIKWGLQLTSACQLSHRSSCSFQSLTSRKICSQGRSCCALSHALSLSNSAISLTVSGSSSCCQCCLALAPLPFNVSALPRNATALTLNHDVRWLQIATHEANRMLCILGHSGAFTAQPSASPFASFVDLSKCHQQDVSIGTAYCSVRDLARSTRGDLSVGSLQISFR